MLAIDIAPDEPDNDSPFEIDTPPPPAPAPPAPIKNIPAFQTVAPRKGVAAPPPAPTPEPKKKHVPPKMSKALRAKGTAKAQRLAEHIEKSLGDQSSHEPPNRLRKQWGKIGGGAMVPYRNGHVWVPTGSTLEQEVPKYPEITLRGDGAFAPKEVYDRLNNPDAYVETDADRPYSQSEREVADELGINPRQMLKNEMLDNDDNTFRNSVGPHMPELLATAVAMAKGFCVGTIDDDGVEKKLYSVPPDPQYLRYLLDQFHGRAPQRTSSVGGDTQDKLVLEVVDYS